MVTTAPGRDAAPFVTFCVLFALIVFLPALLNDGDTLWQIRTGEWILDHRAIPTTDPFSFTAAGRHWFAHEWLAETLMALAFRAAGMPGVMVLAAGATALTGAVMMRYLRHFLIGMHAVLCLAVGLVNAAPSMLARPHLLAWPCLVIWCVGLLDARARRAVPSLWLLLVIVLWVNLHGSFVVGLLLPVPLMIEAIWDARGQGQQALRGWGGFIAAAWVAALCNPDTVGGVLFPFHHIGMQSLTMIKEWQPVTFSALEPLELTILAGLAAGLSGHIKVPPLRVAMLLTMVHGALTHARNEQLLGLIGVLLLAEPIGLALARPILSGKPLGPAWRTAAAAGLLIALTGRLIVPVDPDQSGEGFAALINRVPAEVRARPVLNEYGFGGNLIFAGVRPFIDSRADLYGDAFLQDYRAIAAADPTALAQVLAARDIVWAVFPMGHPVVAALEHTPGWRRFSKAGDVVVLVRADAMPKGM